MKVIKTASYVRRLLASKKKDFDPETWAEAIATEMETVASRQIARVKAKENLEKDPEHYKKNK